ncbi:MAG: PTS sorbitol transporter subunit IIB [Anaerolineales bacterium]
MQALTSFLTRFGRLMGGIVGTLYQAGREAIDQVWKNVLPFLAFVAVIVGIMNGTGLGTLIATALQPLASSVIGLIVLSLIIGLPVLSPLLGPGAVIAQIIGTLLGTLFANKTLPLSAALPALWAINPQVGCDFIPVGLALGEAEPETVEVGVPAVLFSRLITGPIAVIIGWAASLGM